MRLVVPHSNGGNMCRVTVPHRKLSTFRRWTPEVSLVPCALSGVVRLLRCRSRHSQACSASSIPGPRPPILPTTGMRLDITMWSQFHEFTGCPSGLRSAETDDALSRATGARPAASTRGHGNARTDARDANANNAERARTSSHGDAPDASSPCYTGPLSRSSASPEHCADDGSIATPHRAHVQSCGRTDPGRHG
jgi:hypothetical protein